MWEEQQRKKIDDKESNEEDEESSNEKDEEESNEKDDESSNEKDEEESNEEDDEESNKEDEEESNKEEGEFLRIGTWNLECCGRGKIEFWKEVIAIEILTLDLDIIALQEIGSTDNYYDVVGFVLEPLIMLLNRREEVYKIATFTEPVGKGYGSN